MPLPSPSTPQVLALIALRSRDTITAHNLAIVRANLKLADAFFEEFKHMFEWCPPAAGSVAFPRCGRYRGLGIWLSLSQFAACQLQKLDQSSISLAFPQLHEYNSHGFCCFPIAALPCCRLTTSEDVEQFCERVVAGCGVLLLVSRSWGEMQIKIFIDL